MSKEIKVNIIRANKEVDDSFYELLCDIMLRNEKRKEEEPANEKECEIC